MLDTILILAITGISCSLMGSLLLLKQSVMVADAISHTLLLGIVLAFFIVPDLDSPWLMVGAAILGVVTVIAIELLIKTGRIKNDAAIGLVFPAFFSLAVVLISRYLRNVHLDMDIVLLGEIIFAPLNRTEFFGIDLPKALVQGSWLLLVNIVYIIFNYRRLKIRLFDETFARSIGMHVFLLDLVLMTLVSFTSVISFQSIGVILVLALMVAPAMTARCLTNHFASMLAISGVIAIVNSILGYFVAVQLNVSISGMVTVASFITFLVVFSWTNIIKVKLTA